MTFCVRFSSYDINPSLSLGSAVIKYLVVGVLENTMEYPRSTVWRTNLFKVTSCHLSMNAESLPPTCGASLFFGVAPGSFKDEVIPILPP